MTKSWKKVFDSLKLNSKFTLVICFFVALPISVLAGVLFYNMERSVITENRNYMEYTMERNGDHIRVDRRLRTTLLTVMDGPGDT